MDKESGFDTDLVVDADNEENAKVKAEMKGVVVTSVNIDDLDGLAAAVDDRHKVRRRPPSELDHQATIAAGPGAAIQINVQQMPHSTNSLGIASLVLGNIA